jgi:hypothetical protein
MIFSRTTVRCTTVSEMFRERAVHVFGDGQEMEKTEAHF